VGRERLVAKNGGHESDFESYLNRLVKMIPGEVVGLYLCGKGIIPADSTVGFLVWTLICAAGVVAIRIWGTKDKAQGIPAESGVVLISTIAFFIWVYSLGAPPFTSIYVPWIASLAVLVWTFFVPIFYR
jgi:hypothetical protein